MQNKPRFFIAQIGRTVGLGGDLKLHLHTDFPEQFKKGATFQSSKGDLIVENYNAKRGTVRFKGYDDINTAKALTNVKLYADEAQTKANCKLEEGQYFWFDIIGCDVVEKGETLGRVHDIQRMAGTDYMAIDTDAKLVKSGLPKHFLLPYISRYIDRVDIDAKKVYVKDAKDVLEAS
jgi:16S rRNA processing protein RimM